MCITLLYLIEYIYLMQSYSACLLSLHKKCISLFILALWPQTWHWVILSSCDQYCADFCPPLWGPRWWLVQDSPLCPTRAVPRFSRITSVIMPQRRVKVSGARRLRIHHRTTTKNAQHRGRSDIVFVFHSSACLRSLKWALSPYEGRRNPLFPHLTSKSCFHL